MMSLEMSGPPIPPPGGPARVRFDPFELDLGTGELTRNSIPVALPPQPTRILCLLVARAGRLVTRDELREHVWPDTVVEFDHGLNTCIRQIREVLGERADAPRYIQTVPRRGYRFIAPTRAEETAEAWDETAPPAGRARPSAERLLAGAAALGLLAAALTVAGPGATGPIGTHAPVARSSPDPEAEAELARGRYQLANHRPMEAVRHFEAAVGRDPDFALAHALLARARLQARDAEGADAAAVRALELEPRLPEAHQALGDLAAQSRRDWPAALREYRRAIELDPEVAEPRQGYAYVLSLLGRHGEALAEVERALALDPVSPLVNGDAAWLYLYARRYDAAVEQARATVSLAPDLPAAWYCLLMALEAAGDLPEARRVAAGVAERYGAPGEVVAGIGSGSPASGIDRFWRWDLDQMRDHGMADRYPLDFAAAYARFRQPARALAFIERSIDGGQPFAPVIAVDPRFDPLRGEPGFDRALARLNLPVRDSRAERPS